MFVHQILLVQHGLRMFTVPWRIRMYGYVWYKLMLTWLFFLLMVDVAICIYMAYIRIRHGDCFTPWLREMTTFAVPRQCSLFNLKAGRIGHGQLGKSGVYPNSWMVFVRENPIIRNGWWLVEFTPWWTHNFCEWSHGPVEFVDLPIVSMVILHGDVRLARGYGKSWTHRWIHSSILKTTQVIYRFFLVVNHLVSGWEMVIWLVPKKFNSDFVPFLWCHSKIKPSLVELNTQLQLEWYHVISPQ